MSLEAELINSLSKIEAKINALSKSSQQVGTTVGGGMRKVADDTKAATKELEAMSQALDRAVKIAGSRNGGSTGKTRPFDDRAANKLLGMDPTGGAIQRFASPLADVWEDKHGPGMRGALLGLGLLGVAFAAFKQVAEINAEKIRLLIEAENQLRETRLRSIKALDGQAMAGLSQRQAVAQLLTFGGKDAVNIADNLAITNGIAGEDMQQASAMALTKLPPSVVNNAIEMAITAYKGGLAGTVTEAISRIVGDRSAQHLLRMDPTKGAHQPADQALAYLYRNPGQGMDPTLGQRIRDSRRSTDDSESADYLDATDRTNGVSALKNRVLRRRTTERGEMAARADLAATVDPYSAEMIEINKKNNAELETLRRLGEEQNKLLRLIADLTSPQGSYQTQYRRRLGAQAAAMNAGDIP